MLQQLDPMLHVAGKHMSGSAAARRTFEGPAVLSFGFRPFFLFGALWAAVAMGGWIAMLGGWAGPPMQFAPADWHAHEMLFGYLPAAIAGFLLTAVPNWTGRLPLMGWPLLGLFALWAAGRIAVGFGAAAPAGVVAVIDVAFLVVFAAAIGREILAGKTWRNLKVLALVLGLALANAVFHIEAAAGAGAGGFGARLATALGVMLIIVIGGRIVPSFTRNWLVKQAPGEAEPAPYGRFDAATMMVSLLALAAWVAAPTHGAPALACLAAGVANAVRLARWRGWRTGREALVWVLHAGYAFVPLGFLLIASVWAAPEAMAARAAQHVFMAGAIGVMTLAVMTRASLGHTGRALQATAPITAIYVCAIGAALARIASGFAGAPPWLLHAAGALWIAAFLGFAAVYAPWLLKRRAAA